MTTVYFVRHAQTDYSNPIDKDRPLTAEGMQDRYLARDYMVKQGMIGQLTHVYASNFRRAADTVRPIAEAAGLPVEETARKGRGVLLDQSKGLGGFHIPV